VFCVSLFRFFFFSVVFQYLFFFSVFCFSICFLFQSFVFSVFLCFRIFVFHNFSSSFKAIPNKTPPPVAAAVWSAAVACASSPSVPILQPPDGPIRPAIGRPRLAAHRHSELGRKKLKVVPNPSHSSLSANLQSHPLCRSPSNNDQTARSLAL
jgi:hypothetical protein